MPLCSALHILFGLTSRGEQRRLYIFTFVSQEPGYQDGKVTYALSAPWWHLFQSWHSRLARPARALLLSSCGLLYPLYKDYYRDLGCLWIAAWEAGRGGRGL